MTNSAGSDLQYALLALDAYNRGYGSGLRGFSTSGSGDSSLLGKWSILISDASTIFGPEAFNSGFYALAYRNVETGEVVASFRGTDVPLLDDDQRGASDAHKGYGLAFGLPGEGSVEFNVFGQNLVLLADQARLAEQPLACRH